MGDVGSVHAVRDAQEHVSDLVVADVGVVGNCLSLHLQADSQSVSQTDRQTDRQTGRQAGRKID